MCGEKALDMAIDHLALERMCERVHPLGSRSSTCDRCAVDGFHGRAA